MSIEVLSKVKEEREEKLLCFINSFFDAYFRSPTVSEIAECTGILPSTIRRMLLDLHDEGIISYDGFNTVATEHMKQKGVNNIVTLKIVGQAPCGRPSDQLQNVSGTIKFPEILLGKGTFYALIASGDSMINAGIDEGDLIILKETSEFSDGDIVAALNENLESTVKRICYNSKLNRYYLHPENERYLDIYPDKIEVQGVAVKILKNI